MDNMSKRGFDPLNYQFEDQVPEAGSIKEVADGVFWVRMPMMGRLNHINLWLLRDYDGWTIVDTGIFPRCPSVNPMWTTMALAHRCAHRIAQEI